MAKENKLYEYLEEKGYSPNKGKAILVKYDENDLSNKIESFFIPEFFVLTLCENELVLTPIKGSVVSKSELMDKIELTIPYNEVESVEIEEVLLNYLLKIKTKNDTIELTVQQSGANSLRYTGMHSVNNWLGTKNWHSENLEGTLEEIESLNK